MKNRHCVSRRKAEKLFVCILGLVLVAVTLPAGFNAKKVSFYVKFKSEESPYQVMGIFVLPQEALLLEVHDKAGQSSFTFHCWKGEIVSRGVGKWQWTAPLEAGLYPAEVKNTVSGEFVSLNIFVMVPYEHLKEEYLNGYRIGKYPTIPFKRLSIYRPPKGFIEVTKENEDTFVSPHFKLKQFLCKQKSSYPKYLVLRERLLLKLERILEEVNAAGFQASTFNILSGYRTPYYNELIGNPKYSRHVYGGAADIFIDENPEDDMMDDLNRDRKIDYKDAAVLYDIVDSSYGKLWYEPFVGGLARYRKTPRHGPFVHVDVRGFHARWGD